jgi:two-component system chemotaxis sensor kinase CheA
MDDLTLQMFFEEAGETVDDLEAGLLRLERGSESPETQGTAAMLGFEPIVQFAHLLEDVLLGFREAGRPSSGAMGALLTGNDLLRRLLQRAKDKDTGEVEHLAEVTRALRALARGQRASIPVAAPAPRRAPLGPPTLYEIHFRPPPDLLQRGLDPLTILEALGELGEVALLAPDLTRLPPLEQMDPERLYVGFTCRLQSRESRERIEACFEFVGDPAAVTIEAVAGAADAGAADATAPAGETTTLRVPAARVDRLIDLVGELAITQSMVAQLVAGFAPDRLAELETAVAQMDRHVRDLQDRVMAVRMLPIRTAFGRIQRAVRDLAQSQGKQVQLEISGEETELDKGVIEQIGDPLIHLIRNAVDHGIEPPEVRRQAGKPEAGRLELRAYQQGGHIFIEVADDGAGLDRDKILSRAVASGRIAAQEVPADEQVFGLIFEPGFSTAETVTEVSGRGIGMDVVKRHVELLGGSITIQTERGRGTTFRLKLAPTMAVLDGQVLQVGGETYVLPLASIVESVQPRSGALRQIPAQGDVITLRSEVLPVLRLARLFDVPPRTHESSQGLVVVVEDEGRRLGLFVDELLDQRQVVLKSLEANFRKLEGIAGATVLGDGRVALILDVPGLVTLSRSVPRGLEAAV